VENGYTGPTGPYDVGRTGPPYIDISRTVCSLLVELYVAYRMSESVVVWQWLCIFEISQTFNKYLCSKCFPNEWNCPGLSDEFSDLALQAISFDDLNVIIYCSLGLLSETVAVDINVHHKGGGREHTSESSGPTILLHVLECVPPEMHWERAGVCD